MARRLFRRRLSIPGPPPIEESPEEPQNIVSPDDMSIDTMNTPRESIPGPPSGISLDQPIDLDSILSSFSPLSPPVQPLPSLPIVNSPYEEDQIDFTNIEITPDFIKSLDLSFDSDPIVWMKKSCSNQDTSVVTHMPFEDFEKLDLFNIRFVSSSGKSFQTDAPCLSRQELIQYLSTDIGVFPPTNIMSVYTSPRDPSPDNLLSGFTSKPTKRYIVRLPHINYYVTLGSIHRVLALPDKHWFALPLFGGKRRRVGNIFGYFGASMNHGQLSGDVIYKLYTLDEIKNSTITIKENLDDYPIPIDLILSDLPQPFIPTDDYISYLYGTDNSTQLFLKTLFSELFRNYIRRTQFTSPYSLINTLSYETSLSIDLINQIVVKNPLVNINTRNTNGYTALMVILLNKFENIPKQLFQLILSYIVSLNPDVDIKNDDDGSTALMYAFKSQKISDPFLLLQILNLSKNFSITDKDGWDAAMYAFNNDIIYQYPAQLILSILNKITDINRQERKFGWSSLMILFKNSSPHLSNKSIIDKIFTLNPNFNIQNKRGKTAFMYAAFNYNKNIHYSLYNKILSTKPDLNIQSLIGETVLSISLASRYVSNNFVAFILKHFPVNINTKLTLDNSILLDDEDSPTYEPEMFDGYSPLMIAIDNPHVHPSILSLLLSMNPNINHTNAFGETPLMLAINNRSKNVSPEFIFSLLDLKPDLNLQDTSGQSALSLSILNFSRKFDESIVNKILDMSPNVNTFVTDEKLTPLMLSLYNPSGIITPSSVYKILSLNPDINHVTSSGYTILTICLVSLTKNYPLEFVPVEVFDYILTLDLDYSLNKSNTILHMNNASLNLSVNYPNYFIQYSPILDKIHDKLKNLN